MKSGNRARYSAIFFASLAGWLTISASASPQVPCNETVVALTESTSIDFRIRFSEDIRVSHNSVAPFYQDIGRSNWIYGLSRNPSGSDVIKAGTTLFAALKKYNSKPILWLSDYPEKELPVFVSLASIHFELDESAKAKELQGKLTLRDIKLALSDLIETNIGTDIRCGDPMQNRSDDELENP